MNILYIFIHTLYQCLFQFAQPSIPPSRLGISWPLTPPPRHLGGKGPKHKPLISGLFKGNLMILYDFNGISMIFFMGFYRMSWNFMSM